MKFCLPRASAAALSLALLAPLATSQVTAYGSSCAGNSGIAPVLTVQGQPLAGQGMDLTVQGPSLSLGILLAGVSNASWQGLPLPLDLSILGLPGCTLLTSPEVQVGFTTDATGTYTLPVQMNSPGHQAHLQAFLFDPAPGTFGGMSAGLHVGCYLAGGGVPGSVIVSEFMSKPSWTTASPALGEWVELHNTTQESVDVEGWALRDDDWDGAMIHNGGAGVVIPAGGYIVVGISADLDENGGIAMDALVSNFFLSNSSDEIVLTDTVNNEIDRVVYSALEGWPCDQTGLSLALDPAHLGADANDELAHWSLSSCTIVGLAASCNADLGTPGQANDLCQTTPCQ